MPGPPSPPAPIVQCPEGSPLSGCAWKQKNWSEGLNGGTVPPTPPSKYVGMESHFQFDGPVSLAPPELWLPAPPWPPVRVIGRAAWV